MKIAFIGCGNLGSVIVKAVASSGLVPQKNDLFIYDKDLAKVSSMSDEYGVTPCNSNKQAVESADYIFVIVKPGNVEGLLEEIKEVYSSDKIIISCAAGVPVSTYTRILGDVPVVRTIPNLPAFVGEGITGVYFHNVESSEDKENVLNILGTFGESVTVEREILIDEMIAVTSSSPAYVCLFAEAMADGAVRAGFPRDMAYKMVEKTILGTAKYLMETGLPPAVMKDRISSPAGTTIEAIASLESSGFRSSVIKAMEACGKRAKGM